jgi:hypothetical protein
VVVAQRSSRLFFIEYGRIEIDAVHIGHREVEIAGQRLRANAIRSGP